MKQRKIAHIVPVKHLEVTANNQYHMCLAHLVLQNETYANFYRRMVEEGKYVLMDNGAAENEQLTKEQLVEAYNIVKPTELVLLDALSNGPATVESTKSSLRYFKQQGLTCKFMAVPQGATFDEWAESMEQIFKIEGIDSFGVSKFLTMTTGAAGIRYIACSILDLKIKTNETNQEIHLLGCDVGPGEPRLIFDSFKTVRGCDTALGYLFAQAGEQMHYSSIRPKGEIDFINGSVDPATLVAALTDFEELNLVNNSENKTWEETKNEKN